MKQEKWGRAEILGIKVDFLSLKQAVEWVSGQVKYNKVGQITTPNPEQVVLAQKDLEFRSILNHAGLSICDGAGLVWAAKFHNGFNVGAGLVSARSLIFARKKRATTRVAPTNFHRLSGVDLMLALCQKAAEKGWRVMLVGGKPGVAALAAEKIKTTLRHCEPDPPVGGRGRGNPCLAGRQVKSLRRDCFVRSDRTRNDIKIAFNSGSSDIVHESVAERQKIIKEINAFHPNLLFVAYGAPWQEKWIAKNLPQLKINVAMGVGGAFDYLAGKAVRAPQFMRNIGLEWLWRLIQEPWRFKRQLALLKFICLVLRGKQS